MGQLAVIDTVIVIIYLGLILVFGVWIGRFIKSDEDYFLGGKNLPWWAIGMSIVVSDIGALELVGLSGAAYTYGIAVANFDWIAGTPAFIISAMIFVPYFWRSRVFTVSEFLGRRYNQTVRAIVAVVWVFFMAFMLGIFFYTAAKTMNILCGWPIYTSILITALVVGAYTLFGGLAAVVYTDVIQFFVLFAGSMVILLIAMAKVGGWHELTETVHSLGAGYEHHFDLVVPVDSKTPYGWGGILFGLVVVLSPAYCIGNQAIVQRALGARTEHEAKKSMLWGAFLKLFIPVLLVGPGLAGIVLHPGLNNGDDIYPTLIHDLLPPGLTGLVFAAFLAALMSSVDSYLNSGATLWTKDIYQQYIRPGRDEAHYMVVGKVFTACLVAVGIILAPLTVRFPSIFGYMQTLLSIFQGPFLAILALGLLWPRATGAGALAGLGLGVATSSILFWIKDSVFTCPEPFLYIAWWSFLAGLVVTVGVSLFTRPEPRERIEGLVFTKMGKTGRSS